LRAGRRDGVDRPSSLPGAAGAAGAAKAARRIVSPTSSRRARALHPVSGTRRVHTDSTAVAAWTSRYSAPTRRAMHGKGS